MSHRGERDRPRSQLLHEGKAETRVARSTLILHVGRSRRCTPGAVRIRISLRRALECLFSQEGKKTSPNESRGERRLEIHAGGEMRSFWQRPSHHTTDLIGHEAPACSGPAPYCQCPPAKKNRFSGFPDLFPFHNPGHAQMLFPTTHTEVHSRTRLIFTRTRRNSGDKPAVCE